MRLRTRPHLLTYLLTVWVSKHVSTAAGGGWLGSQVFPRMHHNSLDHIFPSKGLSTLQPHLLLMPQKTTMARVCTPQTSCRVCVCVWKTNRQMPNEEVIKVN